MEPTNKQSGSKQAFTIVEILTVMSIIVILITLLVPSLNMAKRYAKNVRQRAQFHSIDVALDLFNADWQGYPPSDANDETGALYCGAMKLAEAMVGQDLLGFHPNSRFRCNGLDGAGNSLYPNDNGTPAYRENLKSRKGPYLQLENANAYRVKHIYGRGSAIGACGEERFVLCDIYTNVTLKPANNDPVGTIIRGKSGMPILYYKAHTANTAHDIIVPANPNNIYNYFDNDELVQLPLPWNTAVYHPMAGGTHPTSSGTSDPAIFYKETWNKKIITTNRPYRSDSYILLSAGYDGEYGTPDDIFNFEE